MAIMTEQQAKELLARVLELSEADECECNLSGSNEGNIRYARNTVTTAGEVSDITLAVQSSFGKKTGVATINEFDDASLKRVVQRSEQLARLAPENPEYMPLLGPGVQGLKDLVRVYGERDARAASECRRLEHRAVEGGGPHCGRLSR